MGVLAIKRAYAPPDDQDGIRILVDRLWPRGLRKDAAALDYWMKEVTPSPELRKWFGHQADRFEEFGQQYRAELDADPEGWGKIRDLLEDNDVTLIYAAKDPVVNHARILAHYLEAHGCTLKNPV